MAILNAFSGGGGLIRIPLEAPTNLQLVAKNAEVQIAWTDPVDKVATPGGEDVAVWNYSIVVRNTERVPVSPGDGIEIVRTSTRDQYRYTAYSDTLYLENNVTYYYAVFAVTTIGAVSESVSGSAKPIQGTPEYYGTTPTSLEDATPQTSGVFAGYVVYTGRPGNENLWRYDSSLTRSVITDVMGFGRDGGSNPGGANTENHFVIAGGEVYSGISTYGQPNADALDSSFTRIPLDPLNDGTSYRPSVGAMNRNYPSPLSFKGSAIFAGYEGSDATVVPDRYDPSLTHSTLAATTLNPRNRMGTVSFGDKALFAGGYGYSGSYQAVPYVDVYDASFTKSTATNLSASRYKPSAAVIGDHAIFAGGSDSAVVDVYDSSLTRSVLDPLPYTDSTIGSHQAINTGGYVMVLYTTGPMGSHFGNALYDSSLTRTSMDIPSTNSNLRPSGSNANINLEKLGNFIFSYSRDASVNLYSIS